MAEMPPNIKYTGRAAFALSGYMVDLSVGFFTDHTGELRELPKQVLTDVTRTSLAVTVAAAGVIPAVSRAGYRAKGHEASMEEVTGSQDTLSSSPSSSPSSKDAELAIEQSSDPSLFPGIVGRQILGFFKEFGRVGKVYSDALKKGWFASAPTRTNSEKVAAEWQAITGHLEDEISLGVQRAQEIIGSEDQDAILVLKDMEITPSALERDLVSRDKLNADLANKP